MEGAVEEQRAGQADGVDVRRSDESWGVGVDGARLLVVRRRGRRVFVGGFERVEEG